MYDGFLQSSLAAARADNFYYPPEWEPKKVCFCLNLVTCIAIVTYLYALKDFYVAIVYRVG